MDQHADRGLEFVLDNRRLIVGFFLLVAVCGVFFVIGFMEGKRQAIVSAPPISEPIPQESAPPAAQPVETAAKPPDDGSAREQLDWYNRVNKPGEATKGLEPAPAPVKAVVKEAPPAPAAPAAVTSGAYSVQVGAFRQRREADAKAAQLKAKGYESHIEPPASSNGLFLLKVGRYSARADAVTMQQRLQRDGFKCFVKAAR